MVFQLQNTVCENCRAEGTSLLYRTEFQVFIELRQNLETISSSEISRMHKP